MQNNVQITSKWSKSKPKVDFQYGGRLFFKNGSNYISAVNWHMSMKFGLVIDFDLLKALTSTNTKPYWYLAVAAAIFTNGNNVIFLIGRTGV